MASEDGALRAQNLIHDHETKLVFLLKEVEKKHDKKDSPKEEEEEVNLLEALLTGNYSTLTSQRHLEGLVNRILPSRWFSFSLEGGDDQIVDFDPTASIAEIRDLISLYISSDSSSISAQLEKKFDVLKAGVGFLLIFLQANWTGPSLPAGLTRISDRFSSVRQALNNEFEVNGEKLYRKTLHPVFLFIAKAILWNANDLIGGLRSTSLWAARCLFVHQQLLENPAEILHDQILKLMDTAVLNYSTNVSTSDDREKQLVSARVLLEFGLIHHYYRHTRRAQELFLGAQQASGLKLKLTGALGKRTKHQTFMTANLVLHAQSAETTSKTNESATVPKLVENTDPDNPLLEKMEFEDEADLAKINLAVVDQAIILALCLNVKNHNPMHGLTTEEMFPYVQRVEQNPNNWMVHSMCLLQKSRLESEKYKTAERAVLQIQALVDQYSDEDATVQERMKCLFEIAFPPRHLLKREMGQRFIALGVAASALQIFEELEMWDEIIQCYVVMEREKKAEEIVRERLAIDGETPELLTLLGDVTKDEHCYRKAWEKSNKRYSRAARTLGRLLLAHGRAQESIEFFEAALAINPLFTSAWFSMGCAALRVEDWNKAIKAFGRVVQLEPEEGQAWNNLASVYIRQKMKKEAFNALQEALKHDYDNWKIWQNFLYVCMDLHEMSHAVQAFHRLLEADQPVDAEVLGMLTDYAIEDMKLSRKDSILMHQVTSLFRAITAKITSTSPIWSLYGKFLLAQGDEEQGLECYFKRARTSQVAGWERDQTLFKDVVDAALELVDAAVKCSSSSSPAFSASSFSKKLYSVRLFVRGIAKKTESTFGGTEPHNQLLHSLNIVQQAEEKLNSTTTG